MAQIYKAYDVRGIYPDDLNEEVIYKIGKAFSDMLIAENENSEVTIVVGQDMRTSSPSLAKNLIRGITEQGVNVIDIGLASSPTFFYGVSILNVDGGLQVSASHNPKEYNGVKFVRQKALPVGYDNGIGIVEKNVKDGTFRTSEKRGTVRKESGVLEKEVAYALARCNPPAIKPMKVVADVANSMGSLYLSKLFDHLPCELIKMNFDLDGTFPAHEADPFKEENLKSLKAKVIKENADIGIATDGDGDRIFFIDDRGDLVEPAILRGILSKIILGENPGATICYDIRPGRITRDMIEQYGGIPSVTRVGHTLIKAKALEENAAFAGESSGHFFFNTEVGLFEMPMIVTLKFMEFISASKMKLSEIVQPLRKYHHSGEINSIVENKDGKINQIADLYKEGKISWLDGVTIEFDDFWFNVRASNTEPLLRLNVEAVTEKIMMEKRDEILKIIRA